MKLVKADIGDPYRPLYTTLHLGPTGTGKTEMVRMLAKAIHQSPDHYCRVDMNTLSQEHYSAALTGAPPGYVGSKEGHSLFQKDIIEGSYSKPGIVLFDEIEKASPQVIQTLLGVLDNGILALSSGEEVIDFRNSIIFMTSNVGSREVQEFSGRNVRNVLKKGLQRVRPGNWDKKGSALLHHVIMKHLEQEFAHEFINRMDDILIFQWLKQNTMKDIVEVQIRELQKRLEKKYFRLQVAPAVTTYLINQSFNKKYGARQVKRIVRNELELPIVFALESGRVKNEIRHVFLHVKGRDITVQFNRKEK